MGVFTLIWYLDLWKTHGKLDRLSVDDIEKTEQLLQLLGYVNDS